MKFLISLLLLLSSIPLFANTNTSFLSLSNFVYFQTGTRLRADIAQNFELPVSDHIGVTAAFTLGMSTQPGVTNYPGNLFHINFNSQLRYHFSNPETDGFYAALNGDAGLVAMPIPGTITLYDWLPSFETGFGVGYLLQTFTFSIKDIPIRVRLEPFLLLGQSFYLYTDAEKISLVSAGRLELRVRLSFHHQIKSSKSKPTDEEK